jgi:hypothetical protein
VILARYWPLVSLLILSLANTNQEKLGHPKTANDRSHETYPIIEINMIRPTFLIASGTLIIELDKPSAFVTTTGGKEV